MFTPEVEAKLNEPFPEMTKVWAIVKVVEMMRVPEVTLRPPEIEDGKEMVVLAERVR